MGSNEPMTVPSVDSDLFCFPPIKNIGVRAAGAGRGWVLQPPNILGESKRNLGKTKRSWHVCFFFRRDIFYFNLKLVKSTRGSGCLARDQFLVIFERDHMLIYIFVFFLLLGTVLHYTSQCVKLALYHIRLVESSATKT